MKHHFHDRPRRRVHVGADVALLEYPRHGRPLNDPATLGIEHVCGRWPDEQEPDGEFLKCIAPTLAPGHTVTRSGGQVTVAPSIACPDCGLHGFIREGRWTPA